MKEINETGLSKYALRNGVATAIGDFKQFYEDIIGHKLSSIERRYNVYINFLESVWSSIYSGYLFETDFVTITMPEGMNKEMFEQALLLLRRYTYYLGLRIIKSEKESLVYIYFDNVINKNTYYVDDEDAKNIEDKIRYSQIIFG